MVHRDSAAKCVDEVRVLQRDEVLGGEVDEALLGDAFDLASVLGFGEEQPVATELVDGVVAGGAREDEDNNR